MGKSKTGSEKCQTNTCHHVYDSIPRVWCAREKQSSVCEESESVMPGEMREGVQAV